MPVADLKDVVREMLAPLSPCADLNGSSGGCTYTNFNISYNTRVTNLPIQGLWGVGIPVKHNPIFYIHRGMEGFARGRREQ